MKKNKDMLRGFALGILLAALIAAIPAASALASKRTIDVVYNDIKLVVDGREVTPLDGAGKVVEPFIYNGTTYLPLRAVANALTGGTKPVSWDQSTYTVYIGERPTEANKTVNMADMKTYPGGATAFKTGQSFNVRQKTYTPFNSFAYYNETFLLNRDYTTFEAMAAVVDAPNASSAKIIIRNADTKDVLFEASVEPGEEPIPVTVDVTGIDKLSISVEAYVKLFNATLTPITKG